jgi:NAD(P)-dependent dehydrogenase (short-subunit alcohol dehydrogenase family)
MSIFSLEGKTAIVTGALGLLGKHHCFTLSEAGANIIACDLNENDCNGLVEMLFTDSMGLYLDVTDPDSITEANKKIIKEFGHIDILVNNAALNDMFENPAASTELSKFENYPLSMWKKSLDVNITGVFLCSQIFGKEMVKQKNGSIINIASTYGIVAPDQSLYKDEEGNQTFYKPPAYSTAKGAVISFTQYLAAYWGKENIRVNALSPGGVRNFQEDFFISNYSKRTPLNRMADPYDYKGAIIFLASEASSYMTGANLVVDGGWTIW